MARMLAMLVMKEVSANLSISDAGRNAAKGIWSSFPQDHVSLASEGTIDLESVSLVAKRLDPWGQEGPNTSK